VNLASRDEKVVPVGMSSCSSGGMRVRRHAGTRGSPARCGCRNFPGKIPDEQELIPTVKKIREAILTLAGQIDVNVYSKLLHLIHL